MRQDRLFRQDTFTGGIIARAVVSDVQPLGDRRFLIHHPHLLHFILPQLDRSVHYFLKLVLDQKKDLQGEQKDYKYNLSLILMDIT